MGMGIGGVGAATMYRGSLSGKLIRVLLVACMDVRYLDVLIVSHFTVLCLVSFSLSLPLPPSAPLKLFLPLSLSLSLPLPLPLSLSPSIPLFLSPFHSPSLPPFVSTFPLVSPDLPLSCIPPFFPSPLPHSSPLRPVNPTPVRLTAFTAPHHTTPHHLPEARNGAVLVDELVPRGNADKADPPIQPGDRLLATSAWASDPNGQRQQVMFKAVGEPFDIVMAAIGSNSCAQCHVAVVLERQGKGAQSE
ncbi:unnamed protein product [Closterium sp. NIES-54]